MPYRDRAVDVFLRKVRQKLDEAATAGPSSTPISASATGSARSRGCGDGSSPLRYGGFTSWRAGAARVAVSMSRRRSSPPMKHRLPLVLAVVALAVAVPASTAAARTTISIERIDVRSAACRPSFAKGYLKAHRGRRHLPARAGRLGRRRGRRGGRPRDDRQLLARPEGHRSGGIVWNRIARDAICIGDEPEQPGVRPDAGSGPGHLQRLGA